MELPWGGLEREAGGRLGPARCAEVREWPGTAIISHEILGTASRVQVARALESLAAHEAPRSTSSSPRATWCGRSPPSGRRTSSTGARSTYGKFLENLRDEQRSAEVAQWFWGVQEVPDVLDRWAESIPRDRVHLVTVPPPGSSPTLLWERFAGLFGIDPAEFAPTDTGQRLARRTGVGDDPSAQRAAQRRTPEPPLPAASSARLLVHQNLSGRPGSPRLSLPEDAYRWASDLGRSWVSELALRGYDVVGDLDDLVPGRCPALRRPRQLRRARGRRGGHRRARHHDQRELRGCATSRSSCTA